MDANELIEEFKRLGATVGDHDGQPGSLFQDGRQIIRVNSRMLFLDEAYEYLRRLRLGSGESTT